jgi:hypothetical protein
LFNSNNSSTFAHNNFYVQLNDGGILECQYQKPDRNW